MKRDEEQRQDDLAALNVLRQFLRSLLGRGKKVNESLKGVREIGESKLEVLVPLDFQRVQAPKGNPFVRANQPLQVRAELRRLKVPMSRASFRKEKNNLKSIGSEQNVDGFASAYSGTDVDNQANLTESRGDSIHSQENLASATDWRTRALGLPAYDHAPLQLGSLAKLDGSAYSAYEPNILTPENDQLDPFSSQNDPITITAANPIVGFQDHDQDSWRPQGHLVGTLYEHAHGAASVTRVEGTDDGRVLVTTGNDGTIKIWNAAQIEKDVAVHSLRTFRLPDADGENGPEHKWSFKPALRTMRNNKAFLVGSDRGNVYLYRLEAGRLQTAPEPVLHNATHAGLGAITCLDHFDTDLESMVLYANQGGGLHGWDVRCRNTAWSMNIPSWCGVPSAMALGHDGHTVTVGTLGGALSLYDLRFLCPLRTLKLSSGAPILDLKPNITRDSPSVFAALGSTSNEVALFDVANAKCVSLFMSNASQEQAEPVQVPTLIEATARSSAIRQSVGQGPAAQHGITPDGIHINLRSACRSPNSVRCLYTQGRQNMLLAAGTDCKVRYWSLDYERSHGLSRCYQVTPGGNQCNYDCSPLGDVFVVSEQPAPQPQNQNPSGMAPRRDAMATPLSKLGVDGQVADFGPAQPDPNHRDAILDMAVLVNQENILVTAGRDGLVKLWR